MSGTESWDHKSSNFGTLDLYFRQVLWLEPDGFLLVKQYNKSANDKHGINSMSFDITKIVQAKLLLMITLNRKINHICLSKNKSTTERSLWTDIFVRNENNPSCIIRDGRVCLYLFFVHRSLTTLHSFCQWLKKLFLFILKLSFVFLIFCCFYLNNCLDILFSSRWMIVL